MKRELLSIAFSLALSVYACSNDEDATCNGADGDQSSCSPNAAGTSSIGSGGTARTAAGGTSAVPWQGGAAGNVSNNAGASGTLDCGLLCPGGNCSAQPACLAQAIGLSEGATIPVCIPPTVVTPLSVCATAQCSNGQPGCQLLAQLGSTNWNVTASGDANVTNVSLNAVVTGLPGTIDIVMQEAPFCTLTAVVPSTGIALSATGKVSSKATNPSVLGLVFDQVQADYTGLTIDSTVEFCRTQGNLLLGTASSSISTALLDNLNSRAQALSCLECRADCPAQLACSAP